MRGQLSAEMLTMMVVVLAVVAIAASQIMGSAKETGKGIKEQTERINLISSEAIKSDEGGFCRTDGEDCREGLACEDNVCR